MNTKVITFALATLFLVSCGKKETKKTVEPAKKEVSETKTEEAKPTSKEIHLTISGTDQMQFDKKELRVKAGQKVILTFKHSGTMEKAIMGHNWVLLKKGTDIPEFAKKAMEAKENEYIPSDGFIAYTKLIGGGNKTEITFNAPEKGTYVYICSFPGHYGIMNGKFIVE